MPDHDESAVAASVMLELRTLDKSARKKLTKDGGFDYEAMTTDELGAHRTLLKRAYEAERDLSTLIYQQKVWDDRMAEAAPANPRPGSENTTVTPGPAVMQVEGR